MTDGQGQDQVQGHGDGRKGTHVVEVREGTERVRVLQDGTVLADTTRPKLLHETGYPVRYYLPPEDVRTDLLTPTATRTHCPFKGDASYWSVTGTGTEAADVVWAYPDPKPAVAAIRDHLCFYAESPGITVETTAE
ncbi:DUF427 domain-containing protein [Streptomyces daliensis]|uniref:DUF427 domain-containing protein n=1 Tax=Streptomyces daliensis TaxID=299421 RepID=A0A8T4ITP9_9ACTN|nr:DUF427 domain-containing protein [Streptomyces daliensis]